MTITDKSSEHKWFPWKFSKAPPGYWFHQQHQLEFLNWFATTFNIDTPEKWYNVSVREFAKQGGGTVLALHGGSLFQVLRDLKPEHKWVPWKFSRVPKGVWEDVMMRR